MTLLLEYGVDLSKEDSEGNISMHYASMFGRNRMIRWLWSNGVEINHSNKHNETPLHFACRSGSIDAIEFLLSNGLDATQKTDEDRDPIFYAAESGELNVVKFLVKNGCSVHNLDKKSTSILHIAVESGNLEMVRFLVEQKMNLNIENNERIFFKKNFFNKIPIFIAAHKNYADIVQLLLKSGADALVLDERQYSLLEYAVLMGSARLCSILLNLNVTFQLDKAFLLSALFGKYEIFQLFLENNANTAVVGEIFFIFFVVYNVFFC